MPLVPDKHIAALIKKRDRLKIREEDIRGLLKPYNLQDMLISLGRWSVHTHFTYDEHRVGKTIWEEPKARVLVSQQALAYLANHAIMSRAGDYKARYLSRNEDNVPALCAVYNDLPDPLELEDESMSGEERLQALVLRWHYEQMTLQFRSDYVLARNVLMFLNSASDKTGRLNRVFIEANGLSITEYLQLAIIVYAGLQHGPDFVKSRFTKADIPQLKVELSDETITSFLEVLKTDYQQFKRRDEEMNIDLDPMFTKNRYNPLFETPIIEVTLEGIGNGYIVPNVVVYQLKAFGGLFWWFHNYYESLGMDPLTEFRTPFGEVFEQYVGRVLRGIYGEANVQGEIRYGDDKRFIDWYVKVGDKVYLFEAKAYQFALSSRRTGYKNALLANEAKKIMDAIKQVYKRVKDIEDYEELAEFRGKEVIPIIVLLDTPYLWSRFFHKWVKEAQVEMADKEELPDLRDFTIYLMDVGELERCDGTAGTVAIEEVLEEATKDVATGFDSILEERLGRPLENNMLKQTADDFFHSIVETE